MIWIFCPIFVANDLNLLGDAYWHYARDPLTFIFSGRAVPWHNFLSKAGDRTRNSMNFSPVVLPSLVLNRIFGRCGHRDVRWNGSPRPSPRQTRPDVRPSYSNAVCSHASRRSVLDPASNSPKFIPTTWPRRNLECEYVPHRTQAPCKRKRLILTQLSSDVSEVKVIKLRACHGKMGPFLAPLTD